MRISASASKLQIVRLLGILPIVATLIIAAAAPSPALAADLTRFDGRTIEFMVGSQPGGGYDRTVRLVAEYMEKTLTGSRTVVSNQSRMGGLVALNRLAEETSEKPVLMMFNTGFLLAQVAGDPLLHADLAQLEYIGKVTSEARYLVVSYSSNLTSWEDVVASKDTLLMPAQAPNSSGYIQSHLIRRAFGVNLKPITGFSGSEARAGLAKGEVQIDLVSENNVERLLKASAAAPILRFGPATVARFADVRDAASIAETEEQKLVVGSISAMTQLGRIIVASPGIPAEDLAVLRAAFAKTMEDPEFLAAAASLGLALDPLSAEGTKALINSVLDSSGPLAELVQRALE